MVGLVLFFGYSRIGPALRRSIGWARAWGSGFWLIRAVLQPIMFSARHTLSIVFTVAFLVGAALHAGAGLTHL